MKNDLNGQRGIELILDQQRRLISLSDPQYWTDDGLEYYRGAADLLAEMIGAYEDHRLDALLLRLAGDSPDDLEWPVLLDEVPSDSPAPEVRALIESLRA